MKIYMEKRKSRKKVKKGGNKGYCEEHKNILMFANLLVTILTDSCIIAFLSFLISTLISFSAII